jgi:hypothetical protein
VPEPKSSGGINALWTLGAIIFGTIRKNATGLQGVINGGAGGGGGGGVTGVITSSLNYASTVTRRANGGVGGTSTGGVAGGNGTNGTVAELFVGTLL